jgi:hypothetical protein
LSLQALEKGWYFVRGVHGDLHIEEGRVGLVDCGYSSAFF